MGLFSVLGGVFGGPIGGAIGGAIDSKQAENDAEAANIQSYEQARTMRQTAYQDTVSDLKNAGLNPMLAFSNGPTAGQNAPVLNKGLSAAQQELNSAQKMNLNADTANKAAQAEQIKAQTDLLYKQGAQTEATTAKTAQETMNLEQIRQNLIKEGYNLTEIGNLTRAQIELNSIAKMLQGQQINESEARTMLAKVEAELKRLGIKGAENLEAFEKTMGTEGGNALKVLQIIRSLMK